MRNAVAAAGVLSIILAACSAPDPTGRDVVAPVDSTGAPDQTIPGSDGGGGMDVAVGDAASPRDVAGCVPTVATGGEATNALCSNGVDDDCDGYVDCADFNCSRSTSVTVCADGGARDAAADVAHPVDAGTIGPTGGTVSLLHFGVFGDVRPPNPNETASYPTTVIAEVMSGLTAEHAQFAVATGDYMFADYASSASAQLDLFTAAETHYAGHVFHALGNHECTGADDSNCPLGTETAQVTAFHTRLASAYSTLYYDFTINTSLGAAHFVVTAPNAWSSAQASWLSRTLAVSARYTFVVAHEPPTAMVAAPGSAAIETAIAARAGGVTARLYGHTHEYRRINPNGLVSGNAGAPLSSTSATYGFAVVDQRSDGNIVVTAYDVGSPPTVNESWVVTPAGATTH